MNGLVGKYLKHEKFRDVMFQVQFAVKRRDHWLFDVLWFHEDKGYYFGKDILMFTEDEVSKLILVEFEE